MFSSTFKRTFSEASYIRSTSQDRFLPFHQIFSLLFFVVVHAGRFSHTYLWFSSTIISALSVFFSAFPNISSLASFSLNHILSQRYNRYKVSSLGFIYPSHFKRHRPFSLVVSVGVVVGSTRSLRSIPPLSSLSAFIIFTHS